jgi:membrane protein implicated in regulation of membrane protease activity
MEIWQLWWVWAAGGLVLAILEVFAPGYFFLGFAAGAVLVGLGLATGLLGGSLPVIALVFAVVSLVAWLIVRRLVGVRRGQVKVWDRDINEN